MTQRQVATIAFLLFLLSGFCGLLYEIVWLRLAFGHFGIVTPVLSIVLSVFMLGIALGSWGAGVWISKQRSWLDPAQAYAVCEIIIGIGAFLVPFLFQISESVLLTVQRTNAFRFLLLTGLVLIASLLPWCAAMGATTPLMMEFLKRRLGLDPTRFSFLYLANVIGGMLGAALTAGIFIELFGFRKTLMMAGLVNWIVAAVALALSSATRKDPKIKDTASAVTAAIDKRSIQILGQRFILGVLFTTGLASLGIEVVLTRVYTPIFGTTIYAFASLLVLYLLATWVGSLAYRLELRSGHLRPIENVLIIVAGAFLLPLLLNDPRLGFGKVGAGLSTFLAFFTVGYLTPRLVDTYAAGDPRKAGLAYALNVMGSISGPLLAGYFLLPWMGAKHTLLIFSAPLLVWAVRGMTAASRMYAMMPALGVLFLAAGACLFTATHEEWQARQPGARIERDSTATVIAVKEADGSRLYVNGISITVLTHLTKLMAHMPLTFFKDKAESTLVICFGMGTTYRSLMSWDIPSVSVELVPSVIKVFDFFYKDAPDVLANKKGTIVIDDGRRFLQRTRQTFDLITIDPPPPVEAFGSSLLYSHEFYALAKKRLTPRGIMAQWFPGGERKIAIAIVRSLQESFQYVRVYRSYYGPGIHILASDAPLIAPTEKEFAERMPAGARADLAEWDPNTNLKTVYQAVFTGTELSVEKLLEVAPGVRITDDTPYNEYYLVRRSLQRS